jgi:hypothetical protein
MSINSLGQISLGGYTAGESIALELGVSATGQISMNDTNVRTLLGKTTNASTISFNDAYSKSAYVYRLYRFGGSTGKIIDKLDPGTGTWSNVATLSAANAGAMIYTGRPTLGTENVYGFTKNNYTYVYTLDKGVTWGTGTFPLYYLIAFSSGGGKLICYGYLTSAMNTYAGYYSTNGTTWTATTGLPSGRMISMTASTSGFMAVHMASYNSTPVIYKSSDGVSWYAPSTSGLGIMYYISEVTYQGGYYMMVGFAVPNNGVYTAAGVEIPKTYRSSDGNTWTVSNTLDPKWMNGNYGGNKVKYIGNNTWIHPGWATSPQSNVFWQMYKSTDNGANWSLITTNLKKTTMNWVSYFSVIAEGYGNYYCQYFAPGTTNTEAYYTTDFITYTLLGTAANAYVYAAI